jgi:hypothetical protein
MLASRSASHEWPISVTHRIGQVQRPARGKISYKTPATIDPNPYAPPKADAESPKGPRQSRAPWRERNSAVILVSGAVFPRRCVVCNQRATNPLPRTLHWHPAWAYPLLFACLLPYFLAAAFLSKKASFEVYLCDAHLRRRTIGKWVGYAGVPLCWLLMMVSTSTPLDMTRTERYLGSFLAAMMVLLAVASLKMVGVVRARRITNEYAWLSVGKPFLESLPDVSELGP